MQQKNHAVKRSRRASISFAAIAAIAAVTLGACATGSNDSSPSSSTPAPESSATDTLVDAPNPCTQMVGECEPVALVDLDGSGKPAAVAITSGRQPSLTAVTDDGRRLTASVNIDPDVLITPAKPSELANTIAFYDLDGRPGAEIVVPVGTRGSTSVFQVFALRDGELRLVSPPGDTFNITLGMGFWTFPGDRILARAMCRTGGLTLGSTEMPTPQLGREIDFISKLDSPKRGEASEWVVAGQTRTVDPAAIADMSVGQTHFKCDDIRVGSLLRSGPAPIPSTQNCDDNADMSPVVEAAIASLPKPPVGEWQTKAVGSGELKTCKRLGYLTITIKMATNSSPVAVLLFRDGVFVGPASSCFAPIEKVQSDGSDAVSVVYRYPEVGESNAASSGRAKFTYTWKDGKVVKAGTASDRLTQLLNCTL